jgi:retron-type reverse transcriptase
MGLEDVRKAARRDRRLWFRGLLQQITPALLAGSSYALEYDAAVGVDGVTWQEYERILQKRVHTLHREIHIGAYRAQPSRRVYIPN